MKDTKDDDFKDTCNKWLNKAIEEIESGNLKQAKESILAARQMVNFGFCKDTESTFISVVEHLHEGTCILNGRNFKLREYHTHVAVGTIPSIKIEIIDVN